MCRRKILQPWPKQCSDGPFTLTGIVFDIQRFCVHDGPGIRTTVFLKGCSARCAWCHNPESFSMRPQVQYYADRCINCGTCTRIGNRGSLECHSNALVMSGKEMDADEVLRQVLDDKPYYRESSGGVTLSGGEPVLQGDFCETLLKRLRDEGIHTNLQTAGFYPFAMLDRLVPFLDMVMYDIKGINAAIYSDYIHADRSLALDNLKRLDAAGVPFIVRTPCVSGVNDSEDEIGAIAQMLAGLQNLQYYMLIPCHSLAKIKYDILEQEYHHFRAPEKERMETLERLAARHIRVRNNYGELPGSH